MRTLRFVHQVFDGDTGSTHLVLETADGAEQFSLLADPELRHALSSTVPQDHAPFARPALGAEPPAVPASPAPSPESVEISPREIQIRVRAGESPAEVAASLGTTPERIARFAGPVVEERLRIADEARRARAHRSAADSRSGESQLVIFGEVVDERFGAHGVAPSEVEWDSHRRDDGEWVVRAEWRRGDTTFGAAWLFHRASRTVSPLDDTATDLLSDRPIRPVMPAEKATSSPLQPGVVAFPPMPEALTGPLPVVEDVFDQDADHRAADYAPAEYAAPRQLRPTPRGDAYAPPADFEEPPLPIGANDPSGVGRLAAIRNLGGRHHETDDERAERVKIPSWDDILLGVRRKQD